MSENTTLFVKIDKSPRGWSVISEVRYPGMTQPAGFSSGAETLASALWKNLDPKRYVAGIKIIGLTVRGVPMPLEEALQKIKKALSGSDSYHIPRYEKFLLEDNMYCTCGVLLANPTHSDKCPFPLPAHVPTPDLQTIALATQWRLMREGKRFEKTETMFHLFFKLVNLGGIALVDEEMFEYFLNVLPPASMNTNTLMVDGRAQYCSFVYREGPDAPIGFWSRKNTKGEEFYFAQNVQLTRIK